MYRVDEAHIPMFQDHQSEACHQFPHATVQIWIVLSQIGLQTSSKSQGNPPFHRIWVKMTRTTGVLNLPVWYPTANHESSEGIFHYRSRPRKLYHGYICYLCQS